MSSTGPSRPRTVSGGSRMRRDARLARKRVVGRLVVLVAVLVPALFVRALRQPRTLETMEARDAADRELAVAIEQKLDLERRLAELEARGSIEQEARERLGMRRPRAGEQEIVPGSLP